MKKDTIFKAALSGAALGLALWGGLPLLHHRHHGVPVVKGPGVTAVLRLSEFSPRLAGTAGDTSVYVLEGKEPGGKALIMGNTHSNEPEGMLSALIIIENAVVEKGTLLSYPSSTTAVAAIPARATATRSTSTSGRIGAPSVSAMATATPRPSTSGPTPTSTSTTRSVSSSPTSMSATPTGPGPDAPAVRSWSG